MKIYTKTGDEGSTGLFGGKRVSKADLRIEAYGTVDELNSWLGLLRDQETNKPYKEVLLVIQNNLFVMGSMLAAEPGNEKIKIPLLEVSSITFLESQIDELDAKLPPMRFFILPGGHTAVSYAHVCRTVCRRAERCVIRLSEIESVNPLINQFLNRLSDYLFVLARKIGQDLNIHETPWKSE